MANEKRLIDANKMREDWLENGENEYVYDTNAVLDSIDAQPTVDAVEVVHGRWERVKFFANATLHNCSICGHAEIRTYNYCPNCGAKMDGGNEDG
jgi:rubrerythrin